ncbi:MAG: LysR family transcriptional regulator [Kofleriaceae bacterium]
MNRLANIEAFVAAAERGSFTLAARALRLSPSALSRRIAQLEEELGVRLFHRTTRAQTLSDDGQGFYDRASGALRELDEASQAARRNDRPVGLLRIEAPTIVGRNIVVPAVRQLVARYSELRVELALRDHALDLAAHGIDVAIRIGPQPDSALVARKLGTTKMRVCGARSYLRRAGKPRSVEDLERHELLGFTSHGRVIPWRLRDREVVRELAPNTRMVVDNGDALVDLAVAGAGLVWLCDFMVGRQPLIELVPESACTETSIYVVAPSSRHVLPKVRAFVEIVERKLADTGSARSVRKAARP